MSRSSSRHKLCNKTVLVETTKSRKPPPLAGGNSAAQAEQSSPKRLGKGPLLTSCYALPETASTTQAGQSNFAETDLAERPLNPPCFVETETTDAEPTPEAPVPPALVEAIERSVGFDGTGFFANRRDQRVEMTGTAYELLKALRAGGDAAIKLAIDRFPPDLRQRAPSPKKPELLAVQLTAKPGTTEQRKACSALASLLVVAQAEGVTVERYREWASGIDLADAEVQAKKIRAALKATAPDEFEGDQTPKTPVYEVQVAVLVDGKRKEAVRVVIEDHQAGELCASIAQAKATGDLTKLGNDIAGASDAGHV
ncbi:hypothetical protein [Methylobacterium sp. J-070]|uniref:hypothetical protein n=1 Tax=Methylobacterium sp. J-070 TaxID=2836650 RepID=UPI001FBB2EC3|nr:hypothetical protein [Methylobacterium sp. J-070]MCJ2052936.1 hypothetical protein [Methylobacterium sp. J-070]